MPPSPPPAQAPTGGWLRTTVQRPPVQPQSVIVASLDASPESLLRQLETPVHSAAAPPETSNALPSPSLDALADMDLTALRQLALQRGEGVQSAFQRFREARQDTEQRREYIERLWEDMVVNDDQEEEEDEDLEHPLYEWTGEDYGEEDWTMDSRDDLLSFDEAQLYDHAETHENEGLEYRAARAASRGDSDWTTLAEDVDSSFWPGLLGERPLNSRYALYNQSPPPSPPPAGITIPPSFFPSPHAASSLPPRRTPADPSSTASPTSFLRSGMSFIGHQSFERRHEPHSLPHAHQLPSFSASSSHPARISSLDPYANLYNPTRGLDYGVTPAPPPGFPSLPRVRVDGAPWSNHLALLDEPLVRDLAAPLQHLSAPTSASALDMSAAGGAGPIRSTNAASMAARLSSERETMDVRARMDQLEGIQVGREEREREVDRARRRVAGDGSQPAPPVASWPRETRSSRPDADQWDDDWQFQFLPDTAEGSRVLRLAKEADRRAGEQWGVKVIIHTYSPSTPSRCVTGLMHAVGVPSAPSPSRATIILPGSSAPKVKDITTFFTGALISFSATSTDDTGEPLLPSTSTARSSSLKLKQTSLEAEYWTRLGPFREKHIAREELKARALDERWLEDVTRGWVLMRWQERDFVNVAPNECTLTIAGHYLIALHRASGAIEGLYCDPSTPPYQSLKLRPAVNSAEGTTGGGGYQLGEFAML